MSKTLDNLVVKALQTHKPEPTHVIWVEGMRFYSLWELVIEHTIKDDKCTVFSAKTGVSLGEVSYEVCKLVIDNAKTIEDELFKSKQQTELERLWSELVE